MHEVALVLQLQLAQERVSSSVVLSLDTRRRSKLAGHGVSVPSRSTHASARHAAAGSEAAHTSSVVSLATLGSFAVAGHGCVTGAFGDPLTLVTLDDHEPTALQSFGTMLPPPEQPPP
jgi:hypothetical protein